MSSSQKDDTSFAHDSKTSQNISSSTTSTLAPSSTHDTTNNNDINSDSYISSLESLGNCSLFVKKTYVMINTCDESIAQWSSDGSSFIIKNPERLSNTIIPQYFNHSNFQSFVRQLNVYGFTKIRHKGMQTMNAMINNQL